MKVQILGSGCQRCKLLKEHAREAIAATGVEAELVEITSIEDIMAMGVMSTPGFAIDGKVKSAGRVLTKDQVAEFLKAATA